MEISRSVISYSGHPTLWKQADGWMDVDTASTLPVQPELPTQAIRSVHDIREAEALLRHSRRQQSLSADLSNQYTRRAINAYADIDRSDQRNYLSSVLGISEYA